MSCRLNLLFGEKIVKYWEINTENILRDSNSIDAWFEHFCSSVHFLAVHEWLIGEILKLQNFTSYASGVEVWFRLDEGRELCGVTVSKRGTLLVWPVQTELRTSCSLIMLEHMKRAKQITVTMRIREAGSDTWGGDLQAEIKANALWLQKNVGKVLHKLNDGTLQKWASSRRRIDDADTYAMNLVRIQDAVDFVKHFSKKKKEGVSAWRKFIAEVCGEEEEEMVVLMCPRRVKLKKENVSSDGLSLLTNMKSIGVLNDLYALLQSTLRRLEKPRLSASLFFSALGISPMCSTESAVAIVSEEKQGAATRFYLIRETQRHVEEYARKKKHDILKREGEYKTSLVDGKVTKSEVWIVDDRIHLMFLVDVSDEVLRSFSSEIEYKNVRFSCQSDSRIFTQAVAMLIQSLQRGEAERTIRLRKEIKTFFAEKKMSFPTIDGRKRRKKNIYFSDYDKPFAFAADGAIIVPDHCASIVYTKEMHATNASLEIW